MLPKHKKSLSLCLYLLKSTMVNDAHLRLSLLIQAVPLDRSWVLADMLAVTLKTIRKW